MNCSHYLGLLYSYILSTILRIQRHQGWDALTSTYPCPKYASEFQLHLIPAIFIDVDQPVALSSTLSGLIVTWRGRYRESILFGWLLWAVGLGLFSTLDEHSGLGKQIGYALLMGFGVGQTLQPSLVAIQAGVVRRDMAVVTGTRK